MLSFLLLCTLAITACIGSKVPAPQASTTQESPMQESSSSGSEQMLDKFDDLDYNLDDGLENFKTIKIGKQIWMAENLNIDVKSSVCYKNDSANCEKYGRLYDWHTAIKVCPKGWHLPTNNEWEELYRYADGTKGESLYYAPYASTVAGKYFKATNGWSYDGNGTDKFGFAALPGGFGFSEGYFSNANDLGYWWSVSDGSEDAAYYHFMDYYYDVAHPGYGSKLYLFSVRCVKD